MPLYLYQKFRKRHLVYPIYSVLFKFFRMDIICNDATLTVELDDTSYRYRSLMGDHSLTLYFSHNSHIEIPLLAYCIFQGERYTLLEPQIITKENDNLYNYTLAMEANQTFTNLYKFRNSVDGRLEFSLTAKPHEHLQMVIDNLNERNSGWSMGSYIDDDEKTITYSHDSCYDAIGMIADTFETEWSIEDKTISINKVAGEIDEAISLSYGKGNGFVSGVVRSNQSNQHMINRVYIESDSRNIDSSTYGNSTLLLPKNQELVYNDRNYITDSSGVYVECTDMTDEVYYEDSLDLTDIYPSRVGEVTSVEVIDEESNLYDILDSTISDELDFSQCVIDGETMSIIFQSGMLAGREFDVEYQHSDRRFLIVPDTKDGIDMPSSIYTPAVGDKYAIFNITLPDEYIEIAENDLLTACVEYLEKYQTQPFTFNGDLDGIWAKKNWENIGGKIKIGGYVLFSDTYFQPEEVAIRITAIKDFINSPYSPQIELSNSDISNSLGSAISKLENETVKQEMEIANSISYSKRRYNDVIETMEMIETAFNANFTDSISPVTVQTMSLLLGDESLQFCFVNPLDYSDTVGDNITYDSSAMQLSSPACAIKHFSLGISSLSSSHNESEYLCWSVAAFTSTVLDVSSASYYLYIKAERESENATFLLSNTAIALEEEDNYYHLLVGILGSEYDNTRSFTTFYGFTEITPGRVTTDKIVSGDGDSFIDLVNNSFRLGSRTQCIDYNTSGDGTLLLVGSMVQRSSGEIRPLLSWEGEWSASRLYYEGDQVTYNGSSYICIKDTSSTEVDILNVEFWTLISIKGETGDTGEAGEDSINIVIHSENGNIFNNGNIETILTAYVYQGGVDISNTLADSAFSWSRNSGDTTADALWAETNTIVGRSITIDEEDVFRKAVFNCSVTI